ncbi:alpha/beta fold hydrolase [Chengkuizengella axinellae]|uniref:Alpha/beta hydrolase n=1 Tax=Chengkuizengella axinellae TaxID=3064388 RepID=A0ABT9ITB3_9BACL|nr:alpha/beta hydrolase [Chengkuizengella sp. 2205SS18-9]MDP5272583.1 alpha/beta hydrolase [Chengkuizengella sp. 2205SS18-9]
MPFKNVNGIKMYYQVKGTGIPIIFIHPPLLTCSNFLYQLEQLSEQFEVITFDVRGHGLSETSKEPLSYSLIVEDIVQLLHFLKIKRCYISGYSTGGSVALEAMLSYPEHFYGGILISAMSEVSDIKLKSRIMMAVGLTTIRAKNLLAYAITRGNADIKQTFKQLFRQSKRGNVQNMKQYYQYSLSYNVSEKLQYIQSPQLLIYGDQDKGFHKYAKILHQGLPHNELHFLAGKTHQIPTKAALHMNDLISNWIIEHQRLLCTQNEDFADFDFCNTLKNTEKEFDYLH